MAPTKVHGERPQLTGARMLVSQTLEDAMAVGSAKEPLPQLLPVCAQMFLCVSRPSTPWLDGQPGQDQPDDAERSCGAGSRCGDDYANVSGQGSGRRAAR